LIAGRRELLVLIVAMLTRMIERGNQLREGDVVCGYVNENGNEEEKIDRQTIGVRVERRSG
jgi:hypothetical protein